MGDSKPASAANSSSSTAPAPAAAALQNATSQKQLYHHQLMLLHQFQLQQQQHSQQQPQPNIMNSNLLSLHQQQQQQQSIMSRFPSNIDAHLRPPGMRSSNFNQASIPNSSAAVNNVAAVQHQMQQTQQQHQMQQIQQQQQAAQTIKSATAAQAELITAAAARQVGNPKELELAQQDAMMVTNPDLKRPFDSIEDAVNRLLPYHILADYEAEEEDSILNSDATGQAPSRQQQWDHNILTKVQEFTNTYEKQVLAFNIMTKKRGTGEFRSEERLMIEQLLLQDELLAINGIRASRDTAEVQMRMAMAQAEQARAQAQMSSGRLPNPIMRSSAGVADDNGGGGDDDGFQDALNAWAGAGNNRSEEPAEDFLNDEHDDDDADEDDDDGELDLNERQ